MGVQVVGPFLLDLLLNLNYNEPMRFFVILLFLVLSTSAKESTSSFTVSGVIKEILQVKVTQVSNMLYNAQVTSNLPNGFKLLVEHDGVINPEDENITVSNQTTGGVFNFPLRFSSAPTVVIVSIAAD